MPLHAPQPKMNEPLLIFLMKANTFLSTYFCLFMSALLDSLWSCVATQGKIMITEQAGHWS